MGQEYLDDFVRIMQTTGERDGFRVRPKSYFARMLKALGEHAPALYGLLRGQRRLRCDCYQLCRENLLCIWCVGQCVPQCNAQLSDAVGKIRWAVETGCTLYDFQGVSGNLDENGPMYGLYRFKKGFNGQLDEYAGEWNYTYRPVIGKLVDVVMAIREKRKRH